MVLVLKAHRELDSQCRAQAEAAGMEVENLTVADIAYPLVTKRVVGVFQQQLCMSAMDAYRTIQNISLS